MLIWVSIEFGHLLSSSACWDASHEHKVFLLTHTLSLSNSCILYTRTVMPTLTQKIYTSMYIHLHTCKYTVPFTSSASWDHYQPPSTQISNPIHEFWGSPCLPFLALILPLFIYCISLFPFPSISLLFSGFLLPVDPVLFLDSNTLW